MMSTSKYRELQYFPTQWPSFHIGSLLDKKSLKFLVNNYKALFGIDVQKISKIVPAHFKCRQTHTQTF